MPMPNYLKIVIDNTFNKTTYYDNNHSKGPIQSNAVISINKGNMEARAEHQRTKQYQTIYTFATSIGVGLVILILFWILYFRNGFAWQSNPSLEFNWHPFLMTLGMLFLYSQGILAYRTGRRFEKKPLKLAHAVLNFSAFVLSVIGLKAAFDSHNLSSKPIPNLYTLHSWIGLATVIIFATQFLIGFTSFLYPGLSQSLRKAVLPVHVSFGTGCFTLAVVAVVTGLLEKAVFAIEDYSARSSEGVLVNIAGLAAALYGLLVLYLLNEPDYKRTASGDDQIVLDRSE
ncbi:unnamed protein product [Phyllotreta striolata]|uniref:Cytochrome b561 domain-containing protein n=1 Tax=Phyllotreta striolata TaxID=444603 RepID=A0A9N9XQS1_PHYSR|nr:unnamed protein product [Phyllotreta striolata]